MFHGGTNLIRWDNIAPIVCRENGCESGAQTPRRALRGMDDQGCKDRVFKGLERVTEFYCER